jgi:hypothetical protein
MPRGLSALLSPDLPDRKAIEQRAPDVTPMP